MVARSSRFTTFAAIASLVVAATSDTRLIAQVLQSPKHTVPRFEVATIKPSPRCGYGGTIRSSAGFLFMEHISLREMIRFAWDIKSDEQLEGVPGWAGSECFDLEAKAEDSDTQTFQKLDPVGRATENRWMLQNLLADRFQLRTHLTRKTLPVYALVIGKRGPKLEQVDAASSPTATTAAGWRLSANNNHLVAQRVSMDRFAEWLTGLPETGKCTVINKTGLDGTYNFVLDSFQSSQEDPGTSIFSALESQLGLRLEPDKAAIRVLVVDRVDHASPN